MDRRKSMTTQYRNNTNDPQKKYRLGTVSKTILLSGLNQFHCAQTSNTTKYDKGVKCSRSNIQKVRKMAKIRNRYNQQPHLSQDTNGKMTTSRLDITNKSQEVSLFPASDHKAPINRRARKHNKIKTEIT